MKTKKTFKSLDELSADSLDIAVAEGEKSNPHESDLLVEPWRFPPEDTARNHEGRGYPRWGINE